MKTVKIDKIDKISCSSKLYDITVKDNSNFFADNILVHNCKIDGLRCNVVVKGDTVTFYSRNGKTFDLLGNLEKEFIDAAKGADVVFDGELLVSENGVELDRQTGNGILNSLYKYSTVLHNKELELCTLTKKLQALQKELEDLRTI